jgi:hypothetical protein
MEYARAAPDFIANPATLPLRNIRIEVRQVQRDDSQRSGIGVEAQGQLRAQAGSTQRSSNAVQQALVLNGRSARIALQSTTPYRVLQTFVRNGTVFSTQSTVFLEAGTGFYATPRWEGATTVELEVSAQQSMQGQNGNAGVNAAQTNSVLLLPLDEWTTIAQSEQEMGNQSTGLSGTTQQSGQTSTEVQVRVSVR